MAELADIPLGARSTWPTASMRPCRATPSSGNQPTRAVSAWRKDAAGLLV
jgi:hypothetical protein